MTRDEFTEQFREIVASSSWSIDDFAAELCASRPTVQRWLDGSACPHPMARDSVLAVARTAC